jgi:hypothetical protein
MKAALQDQADRAAGEDGGSDGERENFRIHRCPPKRRATKTRLVALCEN